MGVKRLDANKCLQEMLQSVHADKDRRRKREREREKDEGEEGEAAADRDEMRCDLYHGHSA